MMREIESRDGRKVVKGKGIKLGEWRESPRCHCAAGRVVIETDAQVL